MKEIIKNSGQIVKILGIVIIAFVLVFLFRWGYEIYFSQNDIIIDYGGNYYTTNSSESARMTGNVASAKIAQKDLSGQSITIDQKYEKTADISSQTTSFQADDQKLRQVIKDNDAVVQMEKLTGLEGSQLLTMTIGVMPDRFDATVESIKNIGDIQSFAVNKVDKTDEYKSLVAEQETLKKTRDSYAAIKEKGGSIQDLLLLEDKILEVEKSLQNLGVDIGLYSDENSFCTVNFSLKEAAKQQVSVRFVLTCAKRSFFWTLGAFVIVTLLIFAALAAVIVALWLFARVKKMLAENRIETHNEENKKDKKNKNKEIG